MSRFVEYLLEELKQSNYSIRQFSEKMGVSHATMLRVIDSKDPQEPTVDFLIKLAKFTGQDIRNLIVMVAPNDVTGTDADVTTLALRFSRLPDEQKQIIDLLIAGVVFKSPKQGVD